jgi:p-hydroxybenzoic acid efflux pump subunit AaeA
VNGLFRKIARYAITVLVVLIAIIIVLKVWSYYTESPWTRDAKFTADVVAISPDVTGLITTVNVQDNQFVKKGELLFQIDRPRFNQALAETKADVDYYQTLVLEKRREADRRNRLSGVALSKEATEQANNSLQTSEHQLAKAQAVYEMAKLDLDRTNILAPADGWITNLNAYGGEFITRGSVAVALVKAATFYVTAYIEETKLPAIHIGDQADITPLGTNYVISGVVESVAAGITNNSSTRDNKGMATVNSNLEWVRLAQRVPVRIRLEKQAGNRYPAGTTATVVILGKKDKRRVRPSILTSFVNRLREFG